MGVSMGLAAGVHQAVLHLRQDGDGIATKPERCRRRAWQQLSPARSRRAENCPERSQRRPAPLARTWSLH